MTNTSIRIIIKRNGEVEQFNPNKIYNAINKARLETNEFEQEETETVVKETIKLINTKHNPRNDLSVEEIQDYVEEALMILDKVKTAKAYILYRAEKAKQRKRDLFKSRKAFKPFEYPEMQEHWEAIQHSYWLHTEFNYTSDIQDYKVNVNKAEKTAIKNAMLAIAQVEVAVKNFWGKLGDKMPKPEISNVGFTFAESEVRHSNAYAHLLELLGLNKEFDKIEEIPALIQRVNYLTAHNNYLDKGTNRDFTVALALFSLFIEHVSLFSQFLVIMSFNKHKNLFKGMSNAIEATSKEEELHGQFGIFLINLIREEHPEWFDEQMKENIMTEVHKAWAAEEKVIDWIYEDGDLDFMPKELTKEFIKNRLNNSLASIGYDRIFEVDEEMVKQTDWFNDEIVSTKHVDFFAKRSINYTKRSQSITEDDLF